MSSSSDDDPRDTMTEQEYDDDWDEKSHNPPDWLSDDSKNLFYDLLARCNDPEIRHPHLKFWLWNELVELHYYGKKSSASIHPMLETLDRELNHKIMSIRESKHTTRLRNCTINVFWTD